MVDGRLNDRDLVASVFWRRGLEIRTAAPNLHSKSQILVSHFVHQGCYMVQRKHTDPVVVVLRAVPLLVALELQQEARPVLTRMYRTTRTSTRARTPPDIPTLI